jgi:hypothetical protein
MGIDAMVFCDIGEDTFAAEFVKDTASDVA